MVSSVHTARVGRDHKIEVSVPDIPEGAVVSVHVNFEPEVTRPRRVPGTARGQGRILPNFDAPLEEFEDEKY